MKIPLLCLWLLLYSSSLQAFQRDLRLLDYRLVDEYVRSLPSADIHTPEQLNELISHRFSREYEQVRAFFIWITENVGYDTQTFFSSGYEKKSAAEVMRQKKAVCQGYSALFEELCRLAGIEAVTVYGFARKHISQIGALYQTNHAWSAVKIEGDWYLLDVTWASGTVEYHTQTFKKELNDYYYLCPPEYFIFDHIPEENQWQLLNPQKKKEELCNLPRIAKGYFYNQLTRLFSKQGIIQTTKSVSISFEAKAPVEKAFIFKSPENFYGVVKSERVPLGKEGRVYTLHYVFEEEGVYWFEIYLNGIETLQYKVIVGKEPEYELTHIDQSDRKNTVKAILTAIKNNDTQLFNRYIPSSEEMNSLKALIDSKPLEEIRQWKGRLGIGRLNYLNGIFHSYSMPFSHEHELHIRSIGNKWYFDSVQKRVY
ncbi:transglutaminase domain-containing protein [Rapidithrix thailandica]|uniref:Transglutaminase domain-containing protein n=1 Tax=Rapidithrix thailandica TaxID=413964 RepID=A0AAW9RTI4_9BACT